MEEPVYLRLVLAEHTREELEVQACTVYSACIDLLDITVYTVYADPRLA